MLGRWHGQKVGVRPVADRAPPEPAVPRPDTPSPPSWTPACGDNRRFSLQTATSTRGPVLVRRLMLQPGMSAAPTPTVLVADDQPDVIAALRLLLRTAGFHSLGAASVEDVRAHLAAHEVDAVLMDLNYARDTKIGRAHV